MGWMWDGRVIFWPWWPTTTKSPLSLNSNHNPFSPTHHQLNHHMRPLTPSPPPPPPPLLTT